MGRWQCYLLMAMEQAPALLWGAVGVAVAMATVGFVFSPVLGVAALAVGLFLLVMVLSFVMIAYGFNSITGVNVSGHTLAIADGGVEAEMEDGRKVSIRRDSIRPYKIYPGGVLVPVKGNIDGKGEGWLWVPPKAFDTAAEFQGFLKAMYTGGHGAFENEIKEQDASNSGKEQKILLHDGDGSARL